MFPQPPPSWIVKVGDKLHDASMGLTYKLLYPIFSMVHGIILGIRDSWKDAE